MTQISSLHATEAVLCVRRRPPTRGVGVTTHDKKRRVIRRPGPATPKDRAKRAKRHANHNTATGLITSCDVTATTRVGGRRRTHKTAAVARSSRQCTEQMGEGALNPKVKRGKPRAGTTGPRRKELGRKGALTR
jgi:hypothetical protein